MAAGGRHVKALENRPVLLPGLDVYFAAYAELSYDRPVGLSVGPIPWSSIINWCQLHKIYDIDDIDVFVRHIRAMEAADAKIADRKEARKKAKS